MEAMKEGDDTEKKGKLDNSAIWDTYRRGWLDSIWVLDPYNFDMGTDPRIWIRIRGSVS